MTNAPFSARLGSVARAPFAVLKQFRPDRPIHTVGVGLEGVLTRTGTGASGISWIDESGQDTVRARFSRSAGFPHGWPDILGLALRCPAPVAEGTDGSPSERTDGAAGEHTGAPVGDCADILLATSGSGRLTRFVPTFHRRVPDGAFTSFMPYRGTNGPVLVAARSLPRAEPLPSRPDLFLASIAAEPWSLDLHWATPLGGWRRFGTVVMRPGRPVDQTERFDPLRNVPVGATNYGWTHCLREPSYELARTSPEPRHRA
ncbi:hypothetical protein ACH9EU_02890 [Kocuria sp. M1R5S2]|uniref:hypothetical protein n=1 Tax=Kocuria rhizosphaerae TaxID=3376285 RepID=UPI0037A9F7A5